YLAKPVGRLRKLQRLLAQSCLKSRMLAWWKLRLDLQKQYMPSVSLLAKDFYSKYEPVTEQYAASAWRSLNQLPLFYRVAHAACPISSYCSEMYNQIVKHSFEKVYKVASHLPLVPTEKIARWLVSDAPLVRNENGHGFISVDKRGDRWYQRAPNKRWKYQACTVEVAHEEAVAPQ
ncbi:hypothetical protein Pfo_002004, partial [Paulownia fortunei]